MWHPSDQKKMNLNWWLPCLFISDLWFLLQFSRWILINSFPSIFFLTRNFWGITFSCMDFFQALDTFLVKALTQREKIILSWYSDRLLKNGELFLAPVASINDLWKSIWYVQRLMNHREALATLNLPTSDGTTPLMTAVKLAIEGMVEDLLSYQVEVNATDDRGL